MKKMIVLLAITAMALSVSAQTKTAYLDLYQRGGARHLRTTLMWNERPVQLGKRNLGEVLNMLSECGWEVDHTLSRKVYVKRSLWFFPYSRHKFHLVLKKEYREGEDPFAGLCGRGGIEPQEKVVFIPEGSIAVEVSEFSGRTNLQEVHLPQQIAKIKAYAFADCSNLEAVYCEALTPPDLGYMAFGFEADTKLTIYVPMASVAAYKQAKGWKRYADCIVGYDFE